MHTTACVTPVMEYWLGREITAAYGGGGGGRSRTYCASDACWHAVNFSYETINNIYIKQVTGVANLSNT